MVIKRSTIDDLNEILEVYKAARIFMQNSGNPSQWGNSYPDKDTVLNDIKLNQSYVCLSDGKIAGVFAFINGSDKDYDVIKNGNWLNEKPYAVMHRLAVRVFNKGVASSCLDWCLSKVNNIRIDTHKSNIPMQKLLLKKGFVQCGTVYVRGGKERIAFQKSV